MTNRKRVIIGGAFLALAYCAFSLLLIPRLLVHSDKYPVTRSPAEVGLSFENIVLQPADVDINIQGWWMPASDPKATMVFVHGGASNRHTSYFKALLFYRAMVEQNVSVLAIDLRNHGASDSDGRGVQFGLIEQGDAKAAIEWLAAKEPALPMFATGISMGGATVIYATENDHRLAGSILIDPLLDTHSTVINSVYAESLLPKMFTAPAAWSATTFFGLPGEGQRPLDVAKTLDKPMLLIQDPTDPVTVARYARELAAANSAVTLWLAPRADPDNPALADKKLWGAHVAAFHLYPEQTTEQIMRFIALHSKAS